MKKQPSAKVNIGKECRVLGIIPARGGSKGIPKKNLAPIAGKPLIAYTFEEALKSRELDRILLSTDDEKIAELGRSFGIEVPFMRPAELASDTATIEAVVAHALAWLSDHQSYVPDAFVILHPTTPLRTARHIDEAIALHRDSKLDAVVSVSPPMEHPSEMVYFDGQKMHFLLPSGGYHAGVQRQSYPQCYFINGAVYVTETTAFHRTGTRIGQSTAPYFMEALDSIDIDTQADLMIAELLLQRRERRGTDTDGLRGHG